MVSKCSVLIVDRSEDARQTLTAARERRGMRILAAEEAERGLALVRERRPDLVVLDLEVADESPEAVCSPFVEATQASRSRLVVLGSLRREQRAGLPGEIVAKPYHYGPLVRRIEELLAAAGPQRGA